MKVNLILFLVALFASNFAKSQNVKITPNPASAQVKPTDEDISAEAKVLNPSTAEKKFKWERKIISITPEWKNAVCDKEACWIPSVNTKEIILKAGEANTMSVHIYPEGKAGSAIIQIKVTEIADTTNTTTGTYCFNTTCSTVSTQEILYPTLNLSPNPTTDFFRIAENAPIKTVEIFNIIGHRVKYFETKSHLGEIYQVDDLMAGVYLVRLLDEQQHTLKTLKLLKK